MRRSIILGSVALLAAVACNKEAQAPVAPEGRQVVVSAQKEQDTKVIFENDKDFIWGGPKETIGLYTYSETNSSYQPGIVPFTLASGQYTSKATFSGTLDADADYGYVAVCPYSEETVFNLSTNVLSFNLPTIYSDLDTSPDGLFAARMPMAAKLNMSGDKTSLAFKNVGGVVKVILTDVPSTARYFKLWTKSGGNISGNFTISLNDIGTGAIGVGATAPQGTNDYVELQAAEGSDIASTIGLCFPVPCGTYVFGIGVYDDNGFKFEKDGTAQNTVSRGTMLVMPEISLNEQPEQPGFPESPAYGYCLIGEFDSYMWNHDVPAATVAGSDDWFVFKNIGASPNGQISFKFRNGDDWATCDNIGAAKAFHKELNTLIHVQSIDAGNENIVLEGTGKYDIYLSLIDELCFILKAGSSFAVPSAYEQEPELPAGTSPWSIVGMIGGGNNWSSSDYHLKTKDGSKWHYLTGVSIEGEFKFRKDDAWTENLGSATGSVLNVSLGSVFDTAQDGPNLKLSSGNYDVYLDPSAKKAYVVAAGGAAPAE